MIRANAISSLSNRSIFQRVVILLVATAGILCLTSLASPSQAANAAASATNTSYAFSYTGTSPTITHTRTFYDGPNFSIPLSQNVIDGKITTFSGQLSFKTKPSGTNWLVYLCADAGNTQCVNVSPTGSWVGSNIWPVPENSSFAGYPAYTEFHYVMQLNDGGSGSIHPALNPFLNPVKLNTQINYTY